MRIKPYITAILPILLVLSEAVFSVEQAGRSGAYTPARTRAGSRSGLTGRATVPPTSYQSGLYRTPNPIDPTSNLVVTGNVGGGKHFRGVVPYNAITDFGGRLNTETTDSFMRYAGSNELSGSYTGKITPYYSQIRTVTAISPGTSVVTRPPSSYIGDRAVEGSDVPALQRRQLSGSEASLFFRVGEETTYQRVYMSATRPASLKPEELDKLLSAGTEISPREKQLRAEQQQAQQEQFEKALEQASSKAAELERKLTTKKVTSEPYTKEQKATITSEELQALRLHSGQAGQTEEETKEESILMRQSPAAVQKRMDVYERMKQQLTQIQRQLQTIQSGPDLKEEGEKAEGQEKEGVEEKAAADKEDQLFEKLSREEVSNRAKAILGEYKSFAAYSEDKFNRYMRAGEMYLKEGRYYLAADAYTLASIHKPKDPLALAGKSHALFAAGEYMSSALYLTRAMEIFPEYAQFSVDIVAMLGDKDKVENRIADIQDWLKRSDAPEMRFLLAYVYYQMGRFNEAKKSIDAAYENMSDAPAVAVLKEVIYEAVR